MKRIIALLMTAALILTAFAGCGKKDEKPANKKPTAAGGDVGSMQIEGAGQDKYAKYDVKGKVSVAVDTARPTDYQALFDAFSEVYPNIELEIRDYTHTTEDSARDYLTKKAATGELPDIVFDEAGPIPLYISQGWVYPITEFVKNDPTFEYIPKNLINDYTFGGELYALPLQATFGGVILNTDVFKALNVPIPECDWSLDDMRTVLEKTTNSEYSAMEGMQDIHHWLAAAFGGDCTLQGYNYEKRQFSTAGSMVKALEYCKEISQLPGVIADNLRSKNSSGKSDYEIKFGSNKPNAGWNNGKIAMGFNSGTWSMRAVTEDTENLMFMPYPQGTPGRINTHVDHCFITTAVKKENLEAAYQVLRYLTFSTEGNLARLSMYTEENEGIYPLKSDKYYPITTNEEVLKMFESLPSVTDVDKYLIEHIKDGYRSDPWKIVPDWYKLRDAYLKEGSEKIISGQADAASTCKAMETKINAEMKNAWDGFEAKLKEVQANFKGAQ